MTTAAVYGTGSWGTAFAAVLADAGTSVTMWGRRSEVVDQINGGVNADYLPDLQLPRHVRATTDPSEASEGADIVVLAVPSQTLRENLAAWQSLIPPSAAVVSLMKGVELGTTKRMSEVISEVGQIEPERVVIVWEPDGVVGDACSARTACRSHRSGIESGGSIGSPLNHTLWSLGRGCA